MELVYLGIVIFLFALSTFDLFVGVSNDAVNFLGSAIGSKVARFKTILIIAAVGIFVGATTHDGHCAAWHFSPRVLYFRRVDVRLFGSGCF